MMCVESFVEILNNIKHFFLWNKIVSEICTRMHNSHVLIFVPLHVELTFALSGSFYENIDHTKQDFEFSVYIACSE